MKQTNQCEEFAACEADYAVPAEPWSRLRYQYGQLLGAEDFTAEQRAFILRHRLHLALLHGSGTVWGLKVHAKNEKEEQKGAASESEFLKVEPGLAVDAVGREIYVDQAQCLDVTRFHKTDLWDDLEESNQDRPGPGSEKDKKKDQKNRGTNKAKPSPAMKRASSKASARAGASGPAAPKGNRRRAYVVLCYEACLSDQVPSITEPCSDADEALTYSRINDRYRIEIKAEPPDDPHGLQREWLLKDVEVVRNDGWNTPRDRLEDVLLNQQGGENKALACFWQRLQMTPLLLATVDLHQEGQKTLIENVDNSVRALLPPLQIVAEQVFGQRLTGAARRNPLRVLTVDPTASPKGQVLKGFTITFSEALHEGSIVDAVKVFKLATDGWTEVEHKTPMALNASGDAVEIVLEKSWAAETTFQVHLTGSGEKPIVSKERPRPLAGWWDEPVPADGRGRDVSYVSTWGEGEGITDV